MSANPTYSVTVRSILDGRLHELSQQFAAWRVDFISRNSAMSSVNARWFSNARRAAMSGLPSRKRSVDCAAGMLGSKMWRSGCGVRSVGRNNARRERCWRRSREGRERLNSRATRRRAVSTTLMRPYQPACAPCNRQTSGLCSAIIRRCCYPVIREAPWEAVCHD
jgi:hypothetical protein